MNFDRPSQNSAVPKSVCLVEPGGPVCILPDAEPESRAAFVPGRHYRTIHERPPDASALPLCIDVELLDLDRLRGGHGIGCGTAADL